MPRKNPRRMSKRPRDSRRRRKAAYINMLREQYVKKTRVADNNEIKENGEYEILISSMDRKGRGIGRIRNVSVFVPHAEIGEKVRVKIVKLRGKYAEGEIIRRI